MSPFPPFFDMNPIHELMCEFDVADAEFVPYWRNADLVGGQDDAIKSSIYRKKEGGSLIVVANVTGETKAAEPSVDWEHLKGPGPLSVTDALDKEPLQTQDRNLKLSLAPFQYPPIRVK